MAGIDEAGRGPLAGPVVAACVVLPPALTAGDGRGTGLEGLTDSKRLTPARREHFLAVLLEEPGVEIGVGRAEPAEIDRLNILRATHLAMGRAVLDLDHVPDLALVDGRPVPGLPCPSVSIVGGDAVSLSVAAASVVAKVYRDRLLAAMDTAYPGYGFAGHKGYGTAGHLAALRALGPCPAHRRSFAPVAACGVPRRHTPDLVGLETEPTA